MLGDVFIKIIADWLVVAVFLIGGGGFLWLTRRQWFPAAARAAVTGLVALWLAKIASLLYQGERPFAELGTAPKAAFLDNPGFPSDHALLVFAITFIVWAATKNKPLAAVLLAMSILVAIGRVVALVHTPADVIGGMLCALIAVYIMYGRRLFTGKADIS